MTSRLIHRDSRPMQCGGPVCGMSDVDADFWRLRRERGQPIKPAPRSFWRRIFGKVM